MTAASRSFLSGPSGGIVFILMAMFGISINDVVIKSLSGAYPLHQMVFVRSGIGLLFSLVLVHFEGGWSILRTDRPWLHMLRAGMLVVANMTYFTAIAVIPLADATALFFVSPLFITLMSVPFLGEKVGWRRLAAVLVGLLGVMVILAPGSESGADLPSRWILLMPVAAAFAYASTTILTRKLGVTSKASALAVYIQLAFILVGLGFFVVAGDGRYAEGFQHESMIFLLRAWAWPEGTDIWLFLLLGLLSTIVGYSMSQAYRLGDAATIAPFEYSLLPMAMIWGFVIFGTLPGINATIGIALILASGIYVFWRQRVLDQTQRGDLPNRRG